MDSDLCVDGIECVCPVEVLYCLHELYLKMATKVRI